MKIHSKKTFNTVDYYEVPEYANLNGQTYFSGVDDVSLLMLFNEVYKELHPLHSCIGFVLTTDIEDKKILKNSHKAEHNIL